MKLALSAPRSKARIGLTPLIDVVFILLLFFMLTSTFVERTAVDVSTPSAAPSAADPADILRIRLDGAGLQVNGAPVPVESLAATLAEQPRDTGGVIIEVVPGVPLDDTVAVMDIARAADLGPLSLIRGRAGE